MKNFVLALPGCALLLLAILLSSGPPRAAIAQTVSPLLQAPFGDHMVVQRNAPIAVWGKAPPGASVTVTFAGASADAVASPSGRWTAELPAQPAGGPHTLRVETGEGTVQEIDDVLVGDVYLCSGQSNMEWPVSRSDGAEEAIASAANDQIRMMKVPLAAAAAPVDTFGVSVEWEVASPRTVPEWSGVCYFFARDLHPEVQVPLGLVNASWGGSDIRAWMSEEALQAVGGYENDLRLLALYAQDPGAAQAEFGELWEEWYLDRSGDSVEQAPWQPQSGRDWAPAPQELGDWKTWPGAGLEDHTGMLWHRTTFTLTENQVAQGGQLVLGGIDEVDQTWVNGHAIGNTFGWGTERVYDVPAAALTRGENVVVVNILNTWGQGGLVGDPAVRGFVPGGTSDSLRFSEWQYEPVPRSWGFAPRSPWESIGGRTTLHNAMVAPLGPMPMTGVLWYQGESNTGEGLAYEALMRALIAQWRDQFGSDAAALVVQLANYGRLHTAPMVSGSAEVREAQRRAVQNDPRAALAVTIDIGDPTDIHPRNKQEVGRRLARAARNVVYGEEVTSSGPDPSSAVHTKEGVEIRFVDVEGALSSRTDPIPGFEFCGPNDGSCRFADAMVDGSRVLLTGDDPASATRIRYCWADSPTCTLYDDAALPVGPFQLEIDAD